MSLELWASLEVFWASIYGLDMPLHPVMYPLEPLFFCQSLLLAVGVPGWWAAAPAATKTCPVVTHACYVVVSVFVAMGAPNLKP